MLGKEYEVEFAHSGSTKQESQYLSSQIALRAGVYKSLLSAYNHTLTETERTELFYSMLFYGQIFTVMLTLK